MGNNKTRNYFFEQIGQMMETEDIYIVSADLAGPPFDEIRKKFPKRYVSVGIAEQNLVSVSCGIAMTGKKVIAYAANPFLVFRAFDQLRNAASLMNIPVIFVGLGTGVSVWTCGTTHFTTEDIAMMSLCPSFKTITVNDISIAQSLVDYVLNSNYGPFYLRFDKDCEDIISNDEIDFNKGWRYIKTHSNEVKKNLVISQGYSSHLLANSDFKKKLVQIIDIYSYPFDDRSLINEMRKYDRLCVLDEQQRRGGLGSIILEILNDNDVSIPIKRFGIDYNGKLPLQYGDRDYWMDNFMINSNAILKEIERIQ